MTQFFVIVTFCGYFSCNDPKSYQFETEEACIQFVEAYRRGASAAATCFDRKTGKIIRDSKGRY